MSVPATRPDASRFTTQIDNPFMTLRPGTTFVYEKPEQGEVVHVTVTRDTVVVDGVTCLVVHDVVYVNGLKVEDTFDWYAQDDQGNVWYFGEDTHEYEPGNPVPINSNGAWTAGVNGAQAGIIMLASPEIGDDYAQEFAPGIAEDRATVESLSATVQVEYGSSTEALQTRDLNPLGPSVERKFYVRGIGNVLTTNEDGEREALTEIIIRGTGKADRLQGYAGGDEMFGGGGNDRMSGDGGEDEMAGGQGDDQMYGGDGGDEMAGGQGADRLFGDEGNDELAGGLGNDRLYGGTGFDRLAGGKGADVLHGGRGGDTFVFDNLRDGLAEVDTILDYRKAQLDVIDLPRGAASIVAETLVDGVWELTLAGDGDRIRLIGVTDRDGDGMVSDHLLFV